MPVVRRYVRSRPLEDVLRGEPDVQLLTEPRYERWDSVIPLPPRVLRMATGPASLERFLVVGDAWNQVVSRYISRPHSTVLDIGCGCGKLARFLVANPYVENYVGFDAMREGVEWCLNFISPPTDHRFVFHHFDIHSETYNRRGAIRAADVVFPTGDDSVDVVVAASLFTHLLEPDARHYLRETRRVLKPDGRAVVSLHVAPPTGVRYAGDEDRIDVELHYFVELAAESGLRLEEDVGDVCGQRTLALAPTAREGADAQPGWESSK